MILRALILAFLFATTATAQERAPVTRVVILDPGHGGIDPGRLGANGLREKEVTLAIAQRLTALLRARGYEVHLTRDSDRHLALDERPRIANEKRNGRPAVFVSIHANASDEAYVRGFETFFLSDASTADERRVAEMENAATRFEDKSAASSEVDGILNGLRNDFWVSASNDLAETVQKGLAPYHAGPDRGVKRAGFKVLVGALMPAVLVEVAFLSNAEEARRLSTSAFRESIALGLADALDRFFETHRYLGGAGGS